MVSKTAPVAEQEKDFGRAFEDALRLFGWRFTHQRTSIGYRGKYVTAITGDKGFPDYFAVRGERALAVELKRDGAYPTPEQRNWLQALRDAGVAAYVWKPKDWEAILEELK